MAYGIVAPMTFGMAAICVFQWWFPAEGISHWVTRFNVVIAVFLGLLGVRAVIAPRNLIKEIWLLLPPKAGQRMVQPEIRIVGKGWPFPFMRGKEVVAPLSDVTITRHYGALGDLEGRRLHNHGITQAMVRKTAYDKAAWEEEVPWFARPFVNFGRNFGRAFRDFQNIFFWGQAQALNNSFVVVRGKQYWKLDGRGLMLDEGNDSHGQSHQAGLMHVWHSKLLRCSPNGRKYPSSMLLNYKIFYCPELQCAL
ncbi:hypothetical protein NA57DRAFT_61356 [Rhizodiscina lignyota]|uniref:Uncharacterized protein n=1 Tax=Rhizodiscina lignyota TaxID=1504668 RepID=A0A9P4I271_9PEZI|nr:hypothetical protein NA57DRAFT_61356 [Rhizodiscina lignyota]